MDIENNDQEEYFLYTDGKLVHKATDEFGNILVFDFFNHRVMTFDSIYEQSRMNLDEPFAPVHEYTKAMLLVLAFIEPESAIILGLGAGSLLRAMHKIYPYVCFDAVDIREQVVKVAELMFGLPQGENVTIHVADAEHYLEEQAYNTTDIIFADMYEAYEMHPLQKQVHFLQQCHRVLSDRGWLVMNFHEMPNNNSSFMIRLNELFPEILVCIVPKGNYIIYAGKLPCDKPFAQYSQYLEPLEEVLNTPLYNVYRRLNRLGETVMIKKPMRNKKEKNHFTDDDYPPIK